MTLNERMLEAIESVPIQGLNFSQLAANECEAIADDFAKGFGEWLSSNIYFKSFGNDNKWLNWKGVSTTSELVTLYKQSLLNK